MPTLIVQITRLVDDHFPGFVECVLRDAEGAAHVFVEKVSVVTRESLQTTNTYPCEGRIDCERVAIWADGAERQLVEIDTELPWHVESISGQTRFVVLAEQVDG